MVHKTKRPWTNGVISYKAGHAIADGDLPPRIIEQMRAEGAFDEPLPVELPIELIEPTIVEANTELEEIG